MPEIIDPRHTDTHVGNAIETLGRQATTKQVAALTGFAESTVVRSAMRLGYVKHGTRDGVWLEPTVEDKTQAEVVEAIGRLTDAMVEGFTALAERPATAAQVEQPAGAKPTPKTSWISSTMEPFTIEGKQYVVVPYFKEITSREAYDAVSKAAAAPAQARTHAVGMLASMWSDQLANE